MKNKFVTIFPVYRDFHFFKDPGQLSFRFKKLGWDATIVCYQNEESYFETKKHLMLKIIPNNIFTKKFNIGILAYLILYGRRINILNLFHFTWQSLFLGFIYKKINPKGFLYIKMDNCHNSGNYLWETIFDNHINLEDQFKYKKSMRSKLKNYLIKNYFVDEVDMWSIEDNESQKYYEYKYQFFRNKLVTSYNGHTVDLLELENKKNYAEKENIILTVGRIGTFQKATDVLIEAFKIVAARSTWNLHLAGDINNSFYDYIKNFFIENPTLEKRIIFHGNLKKIELFKLYNCSKIFCLPSRYEAFANVYSEAMYFGNAIITTSYTSLKGLIIQRKLGKIVEKDNPQLLAECITNLIENEKILIEYSKNSMRFASEELNWDKIIEKLKADIDKRIYGKKTQENIIKK